MIDLLTRSQQVVPKSPMTFKLNPKSTYLLVGGLGGIGRSIGKMMAGMKPGKLVFITRTVREEHQSYLEELRSKFNIQAEAYSCDASDLQQASSLVTSLQSAGDKIGGVINCAMNLRVSCLRRS